MSVNKKTKFFERNNIMLRKVCVLKFCSKENFTNFFSTEIFPIYNTVGVICAHMFDFCMPNHI